MKQHTRGRLGTLDYVLRGQSFYVSHVITDFAVCVDSNVTGGPKIDCVVATINPNFSASKRHELACLISQCVNACKRINGDPVEAIRRAIEAMEDVPTPYCPCCTGTECCTLECTFSADDPYGAYRLRSHREWWRRLREALSDLKGGSA